MLEFVKRHQNDFSSFKFLSVFRLAVEHIIREDYKIEAMDRVQAYIDTLLMRLQLIKDRP